MMITFNKIIVLQVSFANLQLCNHIENNLPLKHCLVLLQNEQITDTHTSRVRVCVRAVVNIKRGRAGGGLFSPSRLESLMAINWCGVGSAASGGPGS